MAAADPLDRWAAQRAPQLLARAEAEAVAVLREALVAAAMGSLERGEPTLAARTARRSVLESEAEAAGDFERPAEAEAGPRGEPEHPAEAGELLWAYCVMRASDPAPDDLAGAEPLGPVERVEAAGLAVLVSRVPRAAFAAEPLRRNLNDLAWLERVARAHESALEDAMATSTIVPLRMCTLYETEESVREMLERERAELREALAGLEGHREWGVKVLVDREQLAAEARLRSPDASAIAEELERTQGDGSAYMVRRRLERELREMCDALAADVADEVHARLQDWAVDAVTRPPQNRDLSGHEGEMLLNAAYLVDAERIEELRGLVDELEARHRALGVRIELTGPWPPYNFTPGGGRTALA